MSGQKIVHDDIEAQGGKEQKETPKRKGVSSQDEVTRVQCKCVKIVFVNMISK